jgi:hypothetical protein
MNFLGLIDESLRPYAMAGPLGGFFIALAPSIFIPFAEALSIRLRKTFRSF